MASVNGEAWVLTETATVASIVDDLGCGTRGVAVAVNGEVVPRSLWAGHAVRHGDLVEVLKAVQGG